LSKQLSEQLRSRQYAAAGLEAKQATVNQYMTSAQSDLANQKEVAQAKLGVAKEQAGVKADIANSGLEAFQTVQNQMNDVYKIELSNISSNADYQNKLAELGFDFYTQQQAQKTADINDKESFAQELFKIKLQNTLNTTNPDYQTEIVSDSSGVFYQISINKNNPSDRIVKNLGVQGEISDSESEDKQIQSFQSDAADYILKMGNGQVNWSAAWSALHAKYPNASTELIDQTLGLDNRAKYDQ
jgi:protein-tyrosine-phosphatase